HERPVAIQVLGQERAGVQITGPLVVSSHYISTALPPGLIIFQELIYVASQRDERVQFVHPMFAEDITASRVFDIAIVERTSQSTNGHLQLMVSYCRLIFRPQERHQYIHCCTMFRLSYKVAQNSLPIAIGTKGNGLAQASYLEAAEAGNRKRGK